MIAIAKAPNPKNRAPAYTGAQFLQNRRFRFKSKNPSKNHRNSISKIKEKSKKIVKKRRLKTYWLLTSIFHDFGSILPPKLGSNFVVFLWFFDVFLQDRASMAPRAPQERPGAPQELPRAPQERPRASQERPRSTRECPRVPHERPRSPREHKNNQKHAKTCKTMQKHAKMRKNTQKTCKTMQKHTKMRKNTQNIHKSTREHIMMTRPGFLALAVMLALTVALALAGPNTRDMSSLLRCSQCKNHRQKQSHSQSQKTGTCHHVVWAPHFLT